MKLRRPVRWIQDRYESLVCDANCRDYQCKIIAYADANGRVLGLECDVIVDSGAYSPWPWPAGIEGGLALGNIQGCYDIRALRGRAINVVSNKPAGQPFRGVARPLSCIGHEIVMDGIAEAVGIDPVEVRLRNFVQPKQMPYVSITKKTLDSGDYAAALKRAAELIDLPAVRARQKKGEPDGRLIGVGFASFYEQTAYGTGPFGYAAWGIELVPGMEPAVARLTGDGELILEVGSHSHGQGHETVFAQVAHEVLGIDPRKVSVRFGDTSTSPAGTGTYTSRSMVTTGGAIAEACRLLTTPITKIGAHLLQCKEGDIQIKNGRVHGPQGSVEFSEIGRAWYHHPEDLPANMDPGGLTATAGHKAHDPGVFSYSAHAAVVAVDPEIGSVEVLDYAIVAGLRHAREPSAGRRPGHRRILQRSRQRALRRKHLRRAGPADRHDARRLHGADRAIDAGRQTRFHRDAVAVLHVRHQGHRRERRHRPAGGDRQRGQRCVAAARRRGVRDADQRAARSRGDCLPHPIDRAA